MTENLLLLVDSRENKIYPHMDVEIEKSGLNIKWERQPLDAGDFAIVDTIGGRTLAVFERKTLSDFASTLTGTRYENKEKMIALRKECGCKLAFIIEAKDIPSQETKFGSVTYKSIESSTFHMFVRDDISTFHTRSVSDTAQFLFRFMRSMSTLLKKCPLSDIKPHFQDSSNIDNNQSSNLDDQSVNAKIVKRLTTKTEKTDDAIVKSIWCQLAGVADSTVGSLMENYTLRDLVEGLDAGAISELKTASGRSFPKNIINSLTNIDESCQLKLLAAVPGISKTTAEFLLSNYSLLEIIDMEDIENIVMNNKRIGVKGRNIKKYFLYNHSQ